MVVNRIGDLGLALGMFVLYYSVGSLDYASVFAIIPYMVNDSINILGIDFNSITVISLLFFIGAVGKSAQLGLHT